MKKFLPALATFLALSAGGAALYLFQRQVHVGAAGAATEFLPADTQLLLSVPDLNGTLSDWKSTDLYKIWMEPEVQAFLARPLSKLPAHTGFDDVLGKIVHLAPTNLFVAVSLPDDEKNQPRLLAGFDFQGDKAEVEQLLLEPKDAVRRQFPAGRADLAQYEGHALETFDTGDGSGYAAVYLDHRYLVANDVAMLRTVIDRCDHRVPGAGGTGTLDKEADFRTVLGKLPPQHATLIFARPQVTLHRLLDLATAAGQPVEDERRAEVEKIKAIGATSRIEGGKLRDSVYYLAPGVKRKPAELGMGGLPLTSADTLAFAASIFEIPTQFELPPDGPMPAGTPMSGLLTSLRELAVMLHDHNVTLERFHGAFGNEVSLDLEWPADRAQPALLASVDVRDQAAAGKYVDDLTNTLSAEAAWSVSHADGATFHTLSGANGGFINPTLTLTPKHLIVGLNLPEVREAARREPAGGANFTATDAYRGTMASVTVPNNAFIYIDGSAFFERLYGSLRAFAVFGALFYPRLGDYVDLTKLPDTKTISKHLAPTVFSQKTDDQGSFSESVGSVTVGQAGFALAGGAAAAAFPLVQSPLGTMLPGLGGPSVSSPDAEPGPGANPPSNQPLPTPQTGESK